MNSLVLPGAAKILSHHQGHHACVFHDFGKRHLVFLTFSRALARYGNFCIRDLLQVFDRLPGFFRQGVKLAAARQACEKAGTPLRQG